MANRSSPGFGISSLTRALLGFTAQDYALAYFNGGVPYSDLGQYENAIDSYTKAIQLDPDYATAYFNRGYSYRMLGHDEKADADKAKACSFWSFSPNLFSNNGNWAIRSMCQMP